jgi:Tol biopolymer transport system component/DNA-binding winged helix-turn-helix (wHTH) protein
MDSPASGSRLVRFGIFELDLRSGDLRKAGARLNLPDQPLQLLVALLERPGELVTRDELRQRLWAEDTFVDFEHGLNAAVKRLRDTLGDSADSPRFIETVPRRGYRFIAPVDSPHVSPSGLVGRLRLPVRIAILATVAVTLLAIGAWWTMRPPTTRKAIAVQRSLTRLTVDPGLQTDVTWSPDGRFIAYASDRAGNFDIWVQPVSGGDAVPVTKSPAQDTEPDWSPDGSKIVFRSERDGGGLYVVPSLGGIESRLTSFGVRPKWSPDGTQVMFASSAEPESRATYVVSLNHSPPHPILESFVDDDLLGVCCRAWHPDGRRVSILGWTRSQGLCLYTSSISGGRAQLTRISPPGQKVPDVMQFQWAPSGAAVYFEGRINLVSNIWRLTVEPETLEAGALERLTTGSGQDTRVALSRDGKYAAFTTQAESIRLWSFPFDTSEGRILGDGDSVTDSTTAAFYPDVAPDGHRIAYTLTGVGTGILELWTKDLVSGEKRRLARDTIDRNNPKWAPDGSRLAYHWHRRNGTTDECAIAVGPATGGDERLLSAPLPRIAAPYGWSADGKSLLVGTNVSSTGSVDLSGTAPVAVTQWSLAAAPDADKAARVVASSPDFDLWQASFSPNGRWVVFAAVRRRVPDGTQALYVIPSKGGDAAHWKRLTDSNAWADKPRWSPDGKRLYFWLRQGSLYNVWGLRFDEAQGTAVGAPFQVTRFEGRARQILSRDLSLSEQSVSRTRLLLPMTDTTGSIWMLDNVDK